ncbi:helix-turn-helix transcriptional regulator [uncultured Granulicatella sp.]|uniref:helix-turn-helix domain-containing protein n=1 Tax=uncultured Granulicatella sp. TaxID=316089 RepID=UPI0028EC871D|nr:helix-turn-helix transcriptional regulator [uncultured Granulicatella sp.]
MQNNFFATNLKFLRTKKGLEQKDISDFLGLKSPTSVTNWEKGTNLARAGHLSELASFFGVSLHDLMNVDLTKASTPELINKDEQDIQKDIEILIKKLDDGLYSKDTAEYDEETRQLLIASLEQVAMIAKLASKKFKPRNFKETKEP